MNKKGFTLVELLAVIAILAILVIIALPNVLELFQSAKKNAFFDEVNAVYTQAVNKYVLTQFGTSTGNQVFCSAADCEKLNVQNGTGDFRYCVIVDAHGKVTTINVTDGEYRFSGTNVTKASELKARDVQDFVTGKNADPTKSSNTITGCAAVS